jgi:CRP/FNR family transcriptional regulator, cyclic AMP receptor protein
MLSIANLVSTRPGLSIVHHQDPGASMDGHEAYANLVPLIYARGARLCLEGHPADGVFGICSGKAKEYFVSAHGKTAILRIAMPGDLVGLEGMIEGTAYPTTVEAIEPTRAYFITKRDFLGAMRRDEHFRLKVTEQLSGRCKCAYRGVRRVGFAAPVPARVAHFLLHWPPTRKGEQSIRIGLTHEEIGQAIGTARETVSRIIAVFRQKGWLRVRGAQWRIIKRAPLSALAAQEDGLEKNHFLPYRQQRSA